MLIALRFPAWLSALSRALAGDGDLDEADLLRRARRGGARGRAAFGQLVAREEAWLLRFLESLLGHRADAEDVAQEALTKAYLGLSRFRGDALFRSWLRIIATREAYTARRRRREVVVAPEALPDAGQEDSGFAGAMAREELLAVLERMPYAWREALVLRHLEGLELPELARVWGVSVPAAKMRLTRARQRFVSEHAALQGETP